METRLLGLDFRLKNHSKQSPDAKDMLVQSCLVYAETGVAARAVPVAAHMEPMAAHAVWAKNNNPKKALLLQHLVLSIFKLGSKHKSLKTCKIAP